MGGALTATRRGRWLGALLLLALAACGGKANPGTVGTWRLGPPMLEPRAWHAMVVLPSGKALVLGGFDVMKADSTVECTASAELYDPALGIWRALPPMAAARCDASAVVLDDGRVLVAGGSARTVLGTHFGYTGYHFDGQRSAELFDPATETWAPAASMHYPRDPSWYCQPLAQKLLDGRVLMPGLWWSIGEERQGPETELYDPASDTWEVVGSMPEPVQGMAMRLPGGQVLHVGGQTYSTPLATRLVALYEPSTRAWRTLAPLAAPVVQHTLAVLGNGKLLLVGGCPSTDFPCTAPVPLAGRLFDPATETWTDTAPARYPRVAAGSVTLPSGRALVVAGNVQSVRSDGRTDPYLSPAAELYDPWTDTWSVTPVMPHYLNEPGALGLLPTGEVIMTGGLLNDRLGDTVVNNRGMSTVQLFRE